MTLQLDFTLSLIDQSERGENIICVCVCVCVFARLLDLSPDYKKKIKTQNCTDYIIVF